MRLKRIGISVITGLLVLALSFWILQGFSPNEPQEQNREVLGENFKVAVPGTRQAMFEPANFYRAINLVASHSPQQTTVIKGGIVPHHLLASEFIADFFHRLKNQSTKTVILIGPNHENLGANIQTCGTTWQTPFGEVEANRELVNQLGQNPLITVNDGTIFEKEHSIAGIVPFISYYLPEATIVPIIISSTVEPSALVSLTDVLASFDSPEVVVLAAVDFSHDQRIDVAETKDQETLDTLVQRDYQTLSQYGNEHLDSPPSIMVLGWLMDRAGARLEVVEHSNSGLLTGSRDTVTSYFEVLYY